MRRTELNWRTTKAPDLAAFEEMAREAFDALPDEFRALCGDVVVLVDDYPDEEVIRELGAEGDLDIMGLYTGVALPFQDSFSLPRSPNTVHLYRVPILLYWAEHDETLGDLVTHVMVHEIGHHFGLSDDDMHGVEDRAAAEGA